MKKTKLNLTYFNGYNEDLCKLIGITDEQAWKYMSLDDWDYAIIIDGNISREKYDIVMRMLDGCCDNTIKYIPEVNKTVGMAYHA